MDEKEHINALEREVRRLKREIARLNDRAKQERSAYSSALNHEKTKSFLHSEQGRYLMMLLANSPNIIFFLSHSGRVEFCTDYFIKKANYEDNTNLMGYPLSDLLIPFMNEKNHAELMKHIHEVAHNNISTSIEVQFYFDGETSDFTGLIVPMTGSGSKNSGTMLLFYNISDLKRSREEAIAANMAKSTFLSNMSHEIRTPLNAIVGMTAIGRKYKNIVKKDEAFDKITSAASFLLDIVNDILDISRIEQGKLELSKVQFEFMQLIKRVESVVSVQMWRKDQLFTVNVDKNIPQYLYGDDHCLAQAMTNILSNATKFAPDGSEIIFSVDLVSLDARDCVIKISVKDEGIGMSPEEQTNIFNAFQQADAGVSRKYGGSGLGLAIAKQIIELMDGKITVKSEKGKGSLFTFHVKLMAADEIVTPNPEKPIILDRDYTGKNILVVDDIEINIEIAAIILESVNATVIRASGAKQAFDYLFSPEGEACDLIFMDLQMPEIDGLQATKVIRSSQMKKAATIPIIAMTANAFKEDIDMCLNAGMNGHLSKPVYEEDFMRVLASYILTP
jgi:signal transduction histidine kinase/CheY-like chemotaxis protein